MITVEFWCQRHMQLLGMTCTQESTERAVIALSTPLFMCHADINDACMDSWAVVMRGMAIAMVVRWDEKGSAL